MELMYIIYIRNLFKRAKFNKFLHQSLQKIMIVFMRKTNKSKEFPRLISDRSQLKYLLAICSIAKVVV